jgi:hypothetical protein
VMGEALPNAAAAIVARSKVVDYLLSETHPDGRGKARFFSDRGSRYRTGSPWRPRSVATPWRIGWPRPCRRRSECGT